MKTFPCEECLLRVMCINKYDTSYLTKETDNAVLIKQVMRYILTCIDSCEYLQEYYKSIPKCTLSKVNLNDILSLKRDYFNIWVMNTMWLNWHNCKVNDINTYMCELSIEDFAKYSQNISAIYEIPLSYFNKLNNLIIKIPINLRQIKNNKHYSNYIINNITYYDTNGFLIAVNNINPKHQLIYGYTISSKKEFKTL